jgi:kynureninase
MSETFKRVPSFDFSLAKAAAQELDEQDILRHKRREFDLPKDIIYLDGNSLGPVTYAVKKRAVDVVEKQWQPDLIKSWNTHGWIHLPQQVGAKIAPLIGAEAANVIACDSISVNLYKLLCVCLEQQASDVNRTKILTQKGNFPTDGYIAQGLIQQKPEYTLHFIDEKSILSALNEDVAVLMLTHVNYKTGDVLDMAAITAEAHAKGILVIWDLAHTAGILPIKLENWQVDYAVGCGYKYLNGGPGAPAFVYAARRHHSYIKQPLSGWMGHAAPFAFSQDYAAAPGVAAFLCGTPSILSMSVLDAALEVFSDVDMAHVKDKTLALSEHFLSLWQATGLAQILPCISPMSAGNRGGQLAFTHPEAYAICQALIGTGVVGDFRAPNVLRLGFAPFYLSFTDIVASVQRLVEIMEDSTYLQEQYQVKQAVT